jgi:hypothetical protein
MRHLHALVRVCVVLSVDGGKHPTFTPPAALRLRRGVGCGVLVELVYRIAVVSRAIPAKLAQRRRVMV